MQPCRACENLDGETSAAEPHSLQRLVYRRKEINRLRLYYLCALCGTQMLTIRGPGATGVVWSATVNPKTASSVADERNLRELSTQDREPH